MVKLKSQAENAMFTGPVQLAGRGAEGTGYLDYQNSTGDFIEWLVDVPTAGTYDLAWRYANGSTNRPLEFSVNGAGGDDSLDFEKTGSWFDWGFVTQPVDLVAGENSLRLTAIGSSGANFDYLEISGPGRIVEISDAIAEEGSSGLMEGVDDFLVFDITLSTPSDEAITLDLLATDGTARGGAIANFGIDLSGNPIDYANQEFEVSVDEGVTWQTANNGTEVTFAAETTALKVRSAINDDATDEGQMAETMSLSVADVLSGPVDLSGDTGTGSIIDNDRLIELSTIYEAEAAKIVGPKDFTGRGASGLGYVDYQKPTGDFIEWLVDVPAAGSYDLAWQYANGDINRPLDLAVNGATEVAGLDFVGTGSWLDWGFVNQSVDLGAGQNTLRLTATGQSGANFDYLKVSRTPRILTISDAIAQEQTDPFLVFNLAISRVLAPGEILTLDLVATDETAKGGLISNFGFDRSGDPVDYANQEFEVSIDGGDTWQAANNGTEVTFTSALPELKVRLAINNDSVDEGTPPESMMLGVASVLAGSLDEFSDTGTGLIDDANESRAVSGCPPISLLPCTDVRVEGNLLLTFDGTDGGLLDGDGDGTGFTMVDPTSNPGNPNPLGGVVGYWPEQLNVDPASGVLQLTTTLGIQYLANNSLNNALGVGLNLPSQAIALQTTLTDLPPAVGGFAQAGLWFGRAAGGGTGSSEDSYIKLDIVTPSPGNYVLEAVMEQDGVAVAQQKLDIPDRLGALGLSLLADPDSQTVTAQYSLDGGSQQMLTTFTTVPEEWFSFDQAGIDPTINTRSFGGIYATDRNAGSSQVFSFDDFSVTETALPEPPVEANFPFDRWSIPVENPTAMELGPDGRLYVATLFGEIHALTIDYASRSFTDEVINTIPVKEDSNRLTLGLAIDPESTADDVTLWVSHSSGSTDNGGLNSGKVSRLSGPNLADKEDVITGLPRAIANHATNDIDFGPDGRLYIWQGGNTGAGSANNIPESEFKDRPEQALSAALLVADVKKPDFNGDAASPIGEFVEEFYSRTNSDVQLYATGLRNSYDGVFHSNGNIYAGTNGLGVAGTVPPVPRLGDPTDRSITTLFGQNPIDNPGKQPDPLNRIVEGGYYGHPNPYRDEVIFKDGSFQGFNASNIPPGHPDYIQPFFTLGTNRSPDGIIEYTGESFSGQLKGNLLIANFSQGDNISRIGLSDDGLLVESQSSLISGFSDPLPLAMGPEGLGVFFVGEFTGNQVTVLEPLAV